MIPFQLIQLTDGTTTLTLSDTVSYAVSSYAPAIAPRNRSQIGGNAPYEAIEEGKLSVTVMGSTAALAVANLLKLWQLLDQSGRWYYSENAPPVRLRLLEQCSALLQPVSALVWVVAGQSPFDLDPTYDQTTGKWLISGVSLHVTRMGQWQNDALVSAASGAVAAGLAMTPTFAAPGTVPMPTRVQIKPTNALTVFPAGYLVTTNDASFVRIDDPFTGSAYDTPTADVSAYGGSFMRFAAVPAGASFTVVGPSVGYAGAFADVWLVLRNPGTSSWRIVPTITRSGGVTPLNPQTLAAGPGNPQIVYLGSGVTDSTNNPQLSLTITNLGAAAANLDVDYAFWVARRPTLTLSTPPPSYLLPITNVVAMDSVTMPSPSSSLSYTIDPWVLNRVVASGGFLTASDRPTPSVYVGQNTDNFAASWRGDAFATTIGLTPSAFLFATDGANWRPMSGAALQTWTATMQRRETYLTPQ